MIIFSLEFPAETLAARCEKNKNEQKLKLPFCHFASGMLAWLLALLCSYQCQTLLSTWDHWTLWTQVDTSPNPSNKLANHEQGILPLWFFTFLFLIVSTNYGCCSGHKSQKNQILNFQTAEEKKNTKFDEHFDKCNGQVEHHKILASIIFVY